MCVGGGGAYEGLMIAQQPAAMAPRRGFKSSTVNKGNVNIQPEKLAGTGDYVSARITRKSWTRVWRRHVRQQLIFGGVAVVVSCSKSCAEVTLPSPY